MNQPNPQRIVDAHIHWWDLENNYYPWLSNQKPEEGGLASAHVLAKSYLPEHYRRDAQGYDIVGVVHVQANWDPADPVGETRWLQQLADSSKANGMPQGIVGFADLSADNLDELLEGHARYRGTRAIRHMMNYIADNPALCWADQNYLENPKWVANFPRLARYGLGFDLMCFSNQMNGMARLAQENPGIPIFLEHTGMPYDHSPAGVALWRGGMRALAAAPNVVCKISGLGNTIPNWTEELIRPYVLDAIETFGVDRCMFASNFPTDSQFSTMHAIWDAFLSITRGCSDAERDKLFASNAIRYYRLAI
ncbi:MAG TPA: amidohydrolase family protein [Candidatus Binataceae bacterium]|nr:amidohydrolase family protein [Candidatus Binataceae bacterium]